MQEMKKEMSEINGRQAKSVEEIASVNRELMEMRREQEEYRREIAALRQENESLKRKQAKARGDGEGIRGELSSLRRFIENFEKEKRQKNIVISSLLMNTGNTREVVEEIDRMVNQILGVNMRVKNIQKLGDSTCLVKLDSLQQKEEIMKNKQIKKCE